MNPRTDIVLVRHDDRLTMTIIDDHRVGTTFWIPISIPRLRADLCYNPDAPPIVIMGKPIACAVVIKKLNNITYLKH